MNEEDIQKKKQRLIVLDNIIRGEKFTVDDLLYKIENGYSGGRKRYAGLLEKHKETLEMYKKERDELLKELNDSNKKYKEIIGKYNSLKSIQDVVDEWFDTALSEIRDAVEDVKFAEQSEIVDIELQVFIDPVEIESFHRRKDKERPATTTLHKHNARVRKNGTSAASAKDNERTKVLKKWQKHIESIRR